MKSADEPVRFENAITGCLLGTAVGDALGLPMEGLARPRQRRMYPDLHRHHFVFGRGMTSDDTEHTDMVAQALIVSAGDISVFARSLSRQMKLWLLGCPAGIGLATLRATTKLCLGCSWERSGVFSAGNGPAMRSALLGVCWGHDMARLRELVHVSTAMTHTDPKAEFGALAVALAAYMSGREGPISPEDYCRQLRDLLGSEGREMTQLAEGTVRSALDGRTTEEYVDSLGLANGVSGYIYHTVPAVVHAWLRHPDDYRSAVTEIIACGGDTDTTAAILGAIVGSRVGKSGIPSEWLSGLAEWPRTVSWHERLGTRLAESCLSCRPMEPLPVSLPALAVRNLSFLGIVLTTGFRRLAPPY